MTRRPQVLDPREHYERRMRQFAAECVAPGGIVLLGSSHFEWFDTERHLPGLPIVNRGIASDRLDWEGRGILHRLDVSVFDCQPAAVVFNNGVNDLGELARCGRPSLAQIAANHRRVIETIRRRSPDTRLIVVNELPARGRFSAVNPLVPQLNDRIAAAAVEFDCPLVDFYHQVVSFDGQDSAGELRAELTWDGLHLNEQGYALLAAALRPLLGNSE